jgi:tight adherence protein B
MDLYLALALAIVAYMAFVVIFPSAIPAAKHSFTRDALERIYKETLDTGAEKEQQVLKDQMGEESLLVRQFFALPFMQPLYEAAVKSGYHQNMREFLVLILGTVGISFVVALMLKLGIASIAVALIMGYLIPMQRCRARIDKRNSQFIDGFPDALDMIVRSVRSGFPLTIALQMLCETTEEPLRSEFRQVVDEISAGRSMNQALARMSLRIDEQDVKFFAVVLAVQQETGGNLGEIVGNLSSILRKRKQLRAKIHAITAEGRATAWVLGSLPVLVFGAILYTSPNYLDVFFNDPTGKMLLAIAISLLVVCAVIVKRMINVKI